MVIACSDANVFAKDWGVIYAAEQFMTAVAGECTSQRADKYCCNWFLWEFKVKEQDMADIKHLIKIRAAPERVYEAVATAEGIRNWWTRDATIESKMGADGEMAFYGKRFIANLHVEALKPNSLVRWRVTNEVWDGKEIEFAFRPNGDDTVLAFAHRGFKEADDKYASANTRWGFYLFSLKRYLDTGKGTPNPDDGDF